MEIIAAGEFTRSDVYAACSALARNWIIYGVAGFGAIVLASGLLQFWAGDAGNVGLISLLLGLLWLTLPWWQPYLATRKLLQSPHFRGPIRFRFSEDGFMTDTPHARGEMKWSAFIRWKDARHTLLLFPHKSMAHIVPKRLFASKEDLEQVRRLLLSQIGPVNKVRRLS